MDRQKMIWSIVFAFGVLALIGNAAFRDAGSVYVKKIDHEFAQVEAEKWVNVKSDEALDYDLEGKERIKWSSEELASYRDYLKAIRNNADQKIGRAHV